SRTRHGVVLEVHDYIVAGTTPGRDYEHPSRERAAEAAVRLILDGMAWITRTASSVERSRSVSSTRRMNLPPLRRAYSQLKSAVRTPPTCSSPVGLGAKRVTTVMGRPGCSTSWGRACYQAQPRRARPHTLRQRPRRG